VSNPVAITVKLAAKILPKTTQRLVAWAVGKRILIVGPKAAGKSSLVHYLVNQRLRPAELPYTPTKNISGQGRFPVPVGEGEILELRVKEALEVPGSWDEGFHAWQVFEEAPDILVIVLDVMEAGASGHLWLDEFTKKLADSFLRKPKLAKKLATIVVLLNKRDRFMGSSSDLNRLSDQVRQKISANTNASAYNLNSVSVLPTVLIDHLEWGDKLASAAISLIARSVYELEEG